MKLYPSSGFSVVEPEYGADGEITRLVTKPIIAFQTSSDESRWVEPVVEPTIGNYTPSHVLIQRSDGFLVTSDGKVGTADLALTYFQQSRRRSSRPQRFSQSLLTAPLKIADGYIYFDD
jgi:hypothetical protein